MIEAKIKELQEEVQHHKEEARKHQKLSSEKEKELISLQGLLKTENIEKKEDDEKEKIKDAKKDKDYEKNQHSQAQTNPSVKIAGTGTHFNEEERVKKHYVIFTGPNSGIFDDWSKAAIFTVGNNVIHKAYPSLKEAKDALQQYKDANSYKAKVQTPIEESKKMQQQAQSINKMRSLGKIPLTIHTIKTAKELEDQVRLTEEIFRQEVKFLVEYTDDDKATSIYPVSGGFSGPKGVALPEADPIKVYMMFQSGLLSNIYFNNMDVFKYFPTKIKMTVRQYNEKILKGKEGFFRIFATIPEFAEGGEVRQPAVQLIQIGQSNRNYPAIGETDEGNQLDQFLNNYTLILSKGIQVKGRVNYAAKSILIWSLQSKQPAEQDIQILNKFLQKTIQIEYDYSKEVKKELCERLKIEFLEDHICDQCESDNSTTPIMEDESSDKKM